MILVILLIVVGAISVFFYYSSKFNSPFIQIFILGKKGSGKSTLALSYRWNTLFCGIPSCIEQAECFCHFLSFQE